MGFRFQRRVTLFPGVRLNFSRRGISTTIGPRGASVTLGGRNGPMMNLGLPGTGLSFRQSLVPRGDGVPSEPLPTIPTVPAAMLADGTEIKSAAVSEVTSDGLGELKTLYVEVAGRREEVRRRVAEAQATLSRAERRLRRARNWFFKLFVGKQEPERAAAVERATEELKQRQAELDGSFIDADLGLDDGAQAAFATLTEAFTTAASCSRVWDVTSERDEDRRVTRSAANKTVDRKPVRFAVADGGDDIILTSADPLRLGNANGADLLVYPGFIVMRDARDIAFVDIREVKVAFAATRCIEHEHVPDDTQVVGQAWLKSNKDGSPDRRFANNRQIPIALYGGVSLKSPGGVHEEYLLSDAAKAEKLVSALVAFQAQLPPLAGAASGLKRTR